MKKGVDYHFTYSSNILINIHVYSLQSIFLKLELHLGYRFSMFHVLHFHCYKRLNGKNQWDRKFFIYLWTGNYYFALAKKHNFYFSCAWHCLIVLLKVKWHKHLTLIQCYHSRLEQGLMNVCNVQLSPLSCSGRNEMNLIWGYTNAQTFPLSAQFHCLLLPCG